MADYWISRKKWTCKYCDITINDDIPSRQQHEGGFRHKNAVERALKDIYRKSEQDKRDQEHARREMIKIERLAREAHQGDIAQASEGPIAVSKTEIPSAEDTTSSAASTSKTPAPVLPPLRQPANKLAAYGSIAADEARRREAQEKEAALKAAEAEEAARREGVAGVWQSVEEVEAHSSHSRPAEEQSDRDRANSFRAREKQAAWDDDEADVGSLEVIKVKKRIKIQGSAAETEEEQRRRMLPQWTSMSMSRAGTLKQEAKEEEQGHEKKLPLPDPVLSGSEALLGKKEAGEVEFERAEPVAAAESAGTDNAAQDTASETTKNGGGTAKGGGEMFRKRKAGAGAGAKKVRIF